MLVCPEEQIICVFGVTERPGVGFTVIVKVFDSPKHDEPPPELGNDGFTVIFETMAAFVEFVAVNEEIFPVPLAASPIAVLSFVQEKIVPVTGPVNPIKPVEVLLQKVKLEG